ncbi:MAG: AMP-binding protein [Piscinibacter sp.]|uniref:AMP-binding protein n=1 Tax=Piscinibacter sp. TaxID=1903157 RepID=UPI001B79B427|nr:AMP-binding protein [Piscinibacter sp.]MBP5991521.1 AMP-binding protein [Piscinibacter sp.]MBP6028734.1 AMP-binding protein [Piscinibacter sp.]
MTAAIAPEHLALQRLYHWEKSAPERRVFTQPLGGGVLRTMNWRELMDETRRMAAHLQSYGFAPGSRIAILSKNCAHWLMSDWAIWMAGHVSVPLYPTLAADTIRQILQHSEAKLLFVGKLDGWEAMKPGVPAGLPCIAYPLAPPTDYPGWDEIVKRTPPLQGEPLRDGDELSTIMYTSGTTGSPKGVMHSFATFAWSIQAGLKRVPIDTNSRMLSYLPLAHVAERTLVEHGLLATGMEVFFAESLDTFTADLQRARPTVFFSVPRLWVKFQQGVFAKMPPAKLERLLKIPLLRGIVKKKILGALGLDQCRFAAGGAAPMPPELLGWYARLGLPIIEVYGMTENCGVSHATVPGVQRPGTVGLPYEGVGSRLDPANGEIQVKSPGLMLGYYKEEALTRQTFTPDGWLHTGDKGSLESDGYLRITGRVKDLFKTSKGKYVAPAPIEDRLVMHASVEACVVTGANLGQPVGIVMLNAEAAQQARDAARRTAMEATLAEHLAAVNAPLDPHEQLDCLVVVSTPWTVDNGFITPTFKVRRNRIEEVYAPRYEGWVAARRKVIWELG